MILFLLVLAVVAGSMALLATGLFVGGRRLQNGCGRLRDGRCCRQPGAGSDYTACRKEQRP